MALDLPSYLLGKSKSSGGTSDYSELTNKPSINGVTLTGNKTSADLGISGGSDDIISVRYGDTSEATRQKIEDVINKKISEQKANFLVFIVGEPYSNYSGLSNILVEGNIYISANPLPQGTPRTTISTRYYELVPYSNKAGAVMLNITGTWDSENLYYTVTQISYSYNTNGYVSNRIALNTTNKTAYTPTSDYNPATKKYVDDSIASAITNALGGNY